MIFKNPIVIEEIKLISNQNNILYSFIAGFLFSFGFTTPISIALLLTMNSSNILFSALVGGLGATIANMSLFFMIKSSFGDEFKKIERTKIIIKIESEEEKIFSKNAKHYISYIISGIIIASPIPNELGVPLLSGLTKVNPFYLALLSYGSSALGIFIILLF